MFTFIHSDINGLITRPGEMALYVNVTVMYGRGTRRRPGSGRIVNVYSKQKSEASLSEFVKAQKHKAESLSLIVSFSR